MDIVGGCGQDAWHPELCDAEIMAWPPLVLYGGGPHVVIRICNVL
jgi:hypothetical protein